MKTPDQTCGQCREAITLEAAGALSAQERLAMEQHLANCVGCRAYASEFRAMTGGLRRLSEQPVTPDAHFRSRWTAAVKNAERPVPWMRAIADLVDWGRLLVLRNRRFVSALAPVWLLILAFRVTAPDAGMPALSNTARSPVEILQALKARNDMRVAFDVMDQYPAPTNAPSVLPRSSRTTTQPVTFRGCPEPILLS